MDVRKALLRLSRYSVVGVSTFLFDLLLLYVLTDFLLWNYLVSAATAFTIAVTVNYVLSRHYVFKGTLRSVGSGYAAFLAIAGAGLATITVLMALFVEVFHWNYLWSRVFIAAIVGMWNYLMNLYVNFKVAGK